MIDYIAETQTVKLSGGYDVSFCTEMDILWDNWYLISTSCIMKRVLTGIKPTWEQLHLGNYFGALKPMIDLANSGEYEVFMFIPNMHALTEFHDAEGIRTNTYNVVKAYLAAGLDPSTVHIYNQSDIPGHVQLYWVLACLTNVGFMKRMHAYKAAVDQGKGDEISVGTFNYPILMAADIILYDPDLVPVGKDQKQHVEYARDIAQKFNHQFGETFELPEPMIKQSVATVPGIDGRKMSKSYNNYIWLFDEQSLIRKKVMRIPTSAVPIEAPKDPDSCNVFQIYKLFLDEQEEQLLRERYTAGGLSFKDVKEELVDLIVTFLHPIQEAYEQIDNAFVNQILIEWAARVAPLAEQKIADVYTKVGFALR